MAKNRGAHLSGKSTEASAPAKKKLAGGRPSTGSASRDLPTMISLEELVDRRSLIEESKRPLSYLLDQSEARNAGDIWLCWPDGCVLLDDIGGTEGFVLVIEKNKAGP